MTNIESLLIPGVFFIPVFILLVIYISLQSSKLRKLEQALSFHSNRLDECTAEISALLKCEKGIGSRLKQQQQQVRNIIERQDKLEVSDGAGTSYRQAMVLLNKGASTDELIDACDMSRGELELLSRLNEASAATRSRLSRRG